MAVPGSNPCHIPDSVALDFGENVMHESHYSLAPIGFLRSPLKIAERLPTRAAKVRPRRTLFTHICHELPQAAEAELPDGVGIAYDGLKLHL